MRVVFTAIFMSLFVVGAFAQPVDQQDFATPPQLPTLQPDAPRVYTADEIARMREDEAKCSVLAAEIDLMKAQAEFFASVTGAAAQILALPQYAQWLQFWAITAEAQINLECAVVRYRLKQIDANAKQ